ncbi:hypothetical protein LF65_03725 [Clostridium beijerinckii]|uniref:Uncharacterized protein n=1 Tax=Clostridium beijerinckii TaxID=1520 RepID=A0A0B5QDI8_CLOBE|nr:hypothetical protein [Clostridium beijerinckii]AJH00280.1 hypothetical protein LF65_03725 [Clostridium beijerinckii]
MKITFEKLSNFSLIYIKLKESNVKVKTIQDPLCELLFDKDNKWIGINIFNESKCCDEFILPKVKRRGNINVQQTDEMVTILFNEMTNTYSKREELCNVDYNENEFLGIELILKDFNCNTEVIEAFTIFS